MYRLILVPLDGSPFGEQALPLACEIARRSGAALRLAHVYVPYSPDPIYIEGAPVVDEQLGSLGPEHARAYLERLRERLAAESRVASSAVMLELDDDAGRDSSVAQLLGEEISASGADLVVMTTHGRGGPARFWLGSIADALIHQGGAPILALRPGEQDPAAGQTLALRRILIPLDGSAVAEAALPAALELGRPMDAEYTLLHVVNPSTLVRYSPIADAAGAAGDDAAVAERRAEAAERYLQGVARRLQAAGMPVSTRVTVSSQPGAAILEAARLLPADLIAMATRGRSGLTRLFVGSIADKVLRGADLPVLLYRPPAAGGS